MESSFWGGLSIFRKKRPAGPSIKKGAFVIGVLGLILALAFVVLERSVGPTLIAISESEVSCAVNRALADAVNRHISVLLADKNLISFVTSPSGEIMYAEVNTTDINRIQAEALSRLQDSMDALSGFKIRVPLGQILGSRVFAALGPKLPVTLYPYGSVRCEAVDSYYATGINQTKFEVALRVNCAIRVVIPLISARTEVSTEIPIVTVLIPGKVPPTYLNIEK